MDPQRSFDPLTLLSSGQDDGGRRASWSSEGALHRGACSEPLSRLSAGPGRSARRHSEPSPSTEEEGLRHRGSFVSAYQSCRREEEAKLRMRLFLLDNSGSTRKQDGCVTVVEGSAVRGMQADRWNEIVSMAVVHALWCGRHRRAVRTQFVLLNPRHGPDCITVYPTKTEAQSLQQVEALGNFLKANGPCGNTPLTSRLKQLRARMEGPKLALTIVTDGLPTSIISTASTDEDKAAFLAELRAWAAAFECSPVIRLVTGKASVCRFYLRLREDVDFKVGLVHGLFKEAQAADAAGNGWLAYTPQLQWLRESGVLEGPLGLLTERALLFAEIAALLQWLFKKELPSHCPRAFCEALDPLARAAAPVYNGRLRRTSPPVDLQRLREALGLARSLAQLGRELKGMTRALSQKLRL